MSTPVQLVGSHADRETTSPEQSGARASMVGGHMKSAAPIDHPQPTLHFTGADVNYHDIVFNDIVEDSGTVCVYNDNGAHKRAVFTRHSRVGHPSPLEHAIFFRRSESSAAMHHKPVIDVIEINHYTHHDNVFTSEKRTTDKLRAILRGETLMLDKDEMLTTMNCQKDGEFVDGVNLPTVTISHPDIIEDSYTISTYAADMMHAYGLKEIELVLREDEFLLDTYGIDTPEGRIPAYFPDVGQAIRDDGLVIAARQFDPLYAAINASAGECQHPSPWYDHCEYVDADPAHYQNPLPTNGSRVIDVQVWRDETGIHNGVNNIRATEENKQVLDQYAMGLKQYYRDIVRFYFTVKDDVVWSPKACEFLEKAFASETHEVYSEFRHEIREVVEAAARRGEYKRADLDSKVLNRLSSPVERMLRDTIKTYTIKIVVRYPIPVTVSSKITDRSGTKGIVGAVLPVEDMPIDEFGQRVHVLRSMNAVPRRSTYSGLFHIYWSAASEQLKMRLKPMIDAGEIDEAFNILLDYLSRYNPDWANVITQDHDTTEKKRELFKEIYDFSIRIWIPHENPKSSLQMAKDLGEFAPKKSKLLLTNYDGIKEWTKNEFYVGYVETLRLDKTGREFSSISSMYTNYLGMIDASNQGRGSYPINYSAKKWGGESEHRLTDGFGVGLFDEVHNRSNSPEVHRVSVEGMYLSPTPSNPGYLVDRNKYPLGDSQVDRMIDNIHRCEGFVLVRPEREDN